MDLVQSRQRLSTWPLVFFTRSLQLRISASSLTSQTLTFLNSTDRLLIRLKIRESTLVLLCRLFMSCLLRCTITTMSLMITRTILVSSLSVFTKLRATQSMYHVTSSIRTLATCVQSKTLWKQDKKSTLLLAKLQTTTSFQKQANLFRSAVQASTTTTDSNIHLKKLSQFTTTLI